MKVWYYVLMSAFLGLLFEMAGIPAKLAINIGIKQQAFIFSCSLNKITKLVTKLNKLGWQADIQLSDGIKSTYEWFLDNIDKFRQ